MFIGASMRKTSFFFLLIEKQVIEEAEEKKGEKKREILVSSSFSFFAGFTDRQYAHAMFIVRTDRIVTIIQLFVCLKEKKMEISSCTKTTEQQRTPLLFLLFLLLFFFIVFYCSCYSISIPRTNVGDNKPVHCILFLLKSVNNA
jgi:hypothetical protein